MQHGDMSSPAVHSSVGTARTVVAPSQFSTDGSQLGNIPPLDKKAVLREPTHACCKAFAGWG